MKIPAPLGVTGDSESVTTVLANDLRHPHGHFTCGLCHSQPQAPHMLHMQPTYPFGSLPECRGDV